MKYLIVIALLCYAYTIYAKNVEPDKTHGAEDAKAVEPKKGEDAKGDKKKVEDAKAVEKKKGEDAKGDKKKSKKHKHHKGKTHKGKKRGPEVICKPPKECKVLD